MATAVLPPSTATARKVRSAVPTSLVRAEGPRSVVVVPGDWDISNRPVLAEVLSQVIASGTGDVVVDLTDAEAHRHRHRPSLGGCSHWLACGGRTLSLRSPSPLDARVLGWFGLTDLIDAAHGVRP